MSSYLPIVGWVLDDDVPSVSVSAGPFPIQLPLPLPQFPDPNIICQRFIAHSIYL